MLKAFLNVSAVLGGHSNMKALGLEWKYFLGNVDEYQNLTQLFQETEITELQGIEGQQKVAERIFKNELKRTYRNVSTLREILLGSREAFTDLEWASGL